MTRAAFSFRLPRFKTLRRKIVVATLVLIVVTFALVALITTLALRTFLNDRLDQQLAAAGNRFSVGLEHPNDHDQDNDPRQFQSVAGQATGTLGARVFDGRVTAAAVVGRDVTSAQLTPSGRAMIATLKPTSRPREVDIPGLGDYRVIVSRGRDGDLLVTGLPEHPVDETIARLVVIETIVFGVALVAVGIAAATSIRFALRPLDRVAATARTVADLPLGTGVVMLEQRVPVNSGRDGEVAQVAAAFNHMLEEVEAALQQRQASEERLRHFIADASHELRTPIAVVRSHAEFAQRASAGSDPDLSRSLDRISAEADRMGHLVDELLLLARLDSGRGLENAKVDLTRIVLDCVSDARLATPGHNWRLSLPEQPVMTTGDDHALRQVLSNLLGNARSHTPAGSTIVAGIRAAGETVEVSVSDDGPGIPTELRARVFERFVHGSDSRTDGSSSSGLGLSIAAAIVAALGGSIEVASQPGSTVFTVRLPLR